MHILCTICSDLVNPAESLYVTKCGHLFHHQCLAQWIERSKSCPQCRNKVTDRCMFRMYPTVSNESSSDDVATLQSRLDDAMLQLRTQRVGQKAMEDNLAAATELVSKKDDLLKAAEKRLVSRESAVAALREQLEYVKIQNRETQRLRDENDALKKNAQTLNGLQKVLNATAAEVEETLKGYSDLRTLATFAAALKRALCESEEKKRSCRAQLHGAEQRLAAERARAADLRAQLGALCESEEKKRSCRAQLHGAEQRLAAERARAADLRAQLGALCESEEKKRSCRAQLHGAEQRLAAERARAADLRAQLGALCESEEKKRSCRAQLHGAEQRLAAERARAADLRAQLGALCESEEKKRSCRAQLHGAEQRLAAERARAADLRAQLGALCESEEKKRSCRAQLHGAEQRLAAERARAADLRAQLGALCESEEKKRSCRAQLHGAEQRLAAERARAADLRAQLGALCESEEKKRSCRAQLHGAEQRLAAERARAADLRAQLGQVQENLTSMERKYEALKHKRKASGDADARDAKQPRSAAPAASSASASASSPASAPASAASTPRQCSSFNDAIVCEKDISDISFGSAVRRIASAESPYLSLKHSGLALRALQHRPAPSNLKPTELAILRNAATSIFRCAPSAPSAPCAPAAPADLDTAFSEPAPPYDGLGGHARPDTFPTPRPKLPKVTSKHKLKRFNSTGSRDISQMFADLRDKD